MKKVNIIAEIGPNHNGKIYLAKRLIKEAKNHDLDTIGVARNGSDIDLDLSDKNKFEQVLQDQLLAIKTALVSMSVLCIRHPIVLIHDADRRGRRLLH